jgi:uncharacterized protein
MTLSVAAQKTEPGKANAGAAAKASYQEMLEKVKKGETVDFKAMRFAFANTDSAYEDHELTKQIHKAFADKDFDEALKIALKQLETSYINIEAQRVSAYMYNKTDKTRSDFHAKIAAGLLNSIISNGDGKTAKTAWTVIDVGEEYAVLNALGYQVRGQSLIQEDGHSFDLMQVIDKESKEAKFYFNVDIVFAAYDKMFKN